MRQLETMQLKKEPLAPSRSAIPAAQKLGPAQGPGLLPLASAPDRKGSGFEQRRAMAQAWSQWVRVPNISRQTRTNGISCPSQVFPNLLQNGPGVSAQFSACAHPSMQGTRAVSTTRGEPVPG